jgi:hypothetical protein
MVTLHEAARLADLGDERGSGNMLDRAAAIRAELAPIKEANDHRRAMERERDRANCAAAFRALVGSART